MDVLIDGKPAPSNLPTSGSLGDVLRVLRTWADGEGRILADLTLDGNKLTPEQEQNPDQVPIEGLGRIEVRSIDRLELARKTIGDLAQFTVELTATHDLAAEKTIAGDYSAAFQAFGECFKGWSLLAAGVRGILPLASEEAGKGGLDLAATFKKTVELLGQFKEAFSVKDVTRLGDLAQYELKPHLEEWRSALEGLKERMAGDSASPS